jgi:hypothetical protein
VGGVFFAPERCFDRLLGVPAVRLPLRFLAVTFYLAVLVPTALLAQSAGDPAPIVVVSVAPLEKIFTDIDRIGASIGFPEVTKQARADIGAKHGIDASKPMGMWVSAAKDKPEELDLGFFVSVTDPKVFEGALQQAGYKVATETEGIKQYTTFIPTLPPTLNGKLVGSTFFLTSSMPAMYRLPRDPAALLGDLPTKYLVGFKIQTKGVAPASLTKLASVLTSMNKPQPGTPTIPGFDMSALQRASEAQSKQLAQAIGDLNEVTGGLKVDSALRAIRADWEGSYKPGSNMANKFAAMKAMKSNVAGLVTLGNVYSQLNIDSITPVEQEVYKATGQMMKQGAEGALNSLGAASSGESQGARKAFVDGIAALIDETTAAGIYDAGLAVRIEGKNLTVAAAMSVSDGKKLEALLKDLAASEKSNPDFPEVLFNFVTHQNVAIHFAKIPTPGDANLKKTFGEEIDVAVGTGAKTGWIVVGSGALEQLKKLVDESTLAAAKPLDKTAQMKISIKPILEFAGAIDPNQAQLKSVGEAAAKFTGNAVIDSHSSATDLGFKGELTISEDVFQLAKDVVMSVIASSFLGAGS